MGQLLAFREPMAAAPRAPILQEGRNCCRVARASRAAVLIDGAAYFQRLDQVLRRAQKSVLIVGWDFDASIKLRPDLPNSPALGDLLRRLAEQRPALEVRVLVWSVAFLHAPSAPLPLIFGAAWQRHPRIDVRLDRTHPLYAAHHQKIVCLDDSIAFAGGIDLTIRRWDTSQHLPEHPLRVTAAGKAYPPVHDVQLMVEGDAARMVADTARERWQRATGEVLAPVETPPSFWPQDLRPDFTDVPVAASRTMPAWRAHPACTEGAALVLDALASARRTIYIEAQYFTSPRIGELLERRLQEPQGPEVVVVIRRRFNGALEGFVMGGNQDRLVQRLRAADRFGRFGVFCPVVQGGPVAVHSKVVIVDDDLLRIGSSNLNNRSIGLDSEFDLTVEAGDEKTRRIIAGLRDTLLAEHIGVAPQVLRDAVAADDSLLRAIARLHHNPRGLEPVPPLTSPRGGQVFGTWLLDRSRPFPGLWP
ncbi:MAG TPA: phospholipase D-like domain-containing protein [Xanthobacteraceae bacterium]|nr:phospholipase D-like domain-containing protein [Xanthobacteraceae bacterium]